MSDDPEMGRDEKPVTVDNLETANWKPKTENRKTTLFDAKRLLLLMPSPTQATRPKIQRHLHSSPPPPHP